MRRSLLLCVALSTLVGCSGDDPEPPGDQCEPNDHTACLLAVTYWVDSCGEQGDEAERCDCGCNDENTACKEPCSCEPDCTGKCCGDDQCGGTCPDACAASGQTCNTGTCACEGTCTPDCNSKECGPDGCGGSCAPGCDPGDECDAGTCVTCASAVCDGVCCGSGETCVSNECCLADCGAYQCGQSCAGAACGVCAQGSFCSDNTCVVSGVETCWSGSICPAASQYCMMSCNTGSNACCGVAPDHPRLVDGTVEDSCEVCCQNTSFPNPVLWPDGGSSCCAAGSAYPFFNCATGAKSCCSQMPQSARACDGTTDDNCMACCPNAGFPVGVVYPDGHTSCCPADHPYPCLNGGSPVCCDSPNQCG